MEELGFVQCQRGHTIFCTSKWGSCNQAVCAFWVNDETGVGPCQELDHVLLMFSQKYRTSGKGEMRLDPWGAIVILTPYHFRRRNISTTSWSASGPKI